ncbi:tripartite tricarboxylate transporter substrate binding protein [Deinococcus sp. Arct2-2]|uniref:Bug family tripartite tricarboxylate transporter substrate binding protein n=1 Tax=Deinococcus sp. Arct2-2 TaxID=2568653 RepID=UPI0010A38923|nr:tripartite tricarboxylate transporter substrate binding protein [Deinococcus sp. Arct2-2]THF71118.1 tripartite tricarboxylate transporter substrate binding protein [Deinococcus sp. Arct2-2]
MKTEQRFSSKFLRITLGVALIVAGSSAGAESNLTLKILAPASVGGGWDNTAKAIAETLKREGIVNDVSVYNLPGKAGTLGLAEFVKLKGQSNQQMLTGFVMVAGIPINQSPFDLNSDVTPIARLTTDYEVLIVPAKSRFRDVEDLVAAFKAAPSSIRFGGSSAGGSAHIAIGKLARELNISMDQVRYVPSAGGAQATAAMLGGELDVVSAGYSEIEDALKSGQVRGLAILAPEAVNGINLPTLIEKGIDVDVSNWRGVVAPAGISAAQRARLTLMMTRMVRTRTWQQQLSQNKWNAYFATGDTFDRFIRSQKTVVAQLLRSLDILK